MLPEETRRSSTRARRSPSSRRLQQLRAESFETLDYDTVMVLDSHWFTTVEFVVTAQDRRAGLFTAEELPRGMCRIPYEWRGDPELARAMADRRRRAGHLDHRRSTTPTCRCTTPTLNLWHFLGKGLGQAVDVDVSVCQTGDTEDFLRVGRALGDGDRRRPTAR